MFDDIGVVAFANALIDPTEFAPAFPNSDICLGTCGHEFQVICSPSYQGRWLLIPKECMPLWVQLDDILVIIEQIQRHSL